MTSSYSPRLGFSLIEVLVALVVLCVAVIALQGTSAILLRALAGAHRAAIGAGLASRQRERVFATTCTAVSASDSDDAVTVDGTFAPTSLRTSGGSQTQHFPARPGASTLGYSVLGPCR